MKAVKVWEFPVRVIHWVNFVAIVTLCLTGAYIHYPFLQTANRPDLWAMNYARYVHLICGWALMCGVGGRIVWGLIGNHYARIGAFFPFLTAKGRKGLLEVLQYYTFLKVRKSPAMGHNELASLSYLGFFVLMIFQILTGFALFAQYDPAGTAYAATGWVFAFASNGYVRLAHYFVMFLVMTFVILHVYAMWISDVAEHDGTAGSIFNGYKFGEEE